MAFIRYETVPVPVSFNALGLVGTVTAIGLKATLKKSGEEIFEEIVLKKLGTKFVPVVGWAVLASEAISDVMSLAGYSGMIIHTKCAVIERTKHQAGQVFVVTNVEPRSIERIELVKED